MQFHIRTLLVVTFAVSLLCGLVFAVPPIVCIPVLCTILWICPAVWINGIVYGRRAWRAFFIGGTIAGLVPHLASLYFSVAVVTTLLEGGGMTALFELNGRSPNLNAAATFLAPGPFAIIGGLVGVWTWWMFQPAKGAATADQRTNHAPAVDEYVIVSGRLTTAPIERKT